jgi:hypothetical protein
LLKREEALSVLHRALRVIDENDLWGKLDLNAVREYVEHLEPGFDEKRYGFAQFAELLNYAQDLSLVRLEPDDHAVLRVYPGSEFTPSRPAVQSARPVVVEEAAPAMVMEAGSPVAQTIATEEAAATVDAVAIEEAPVDGGAPKKKRTYHRRGSRTRQTARKPRKPQPVSGE